MSTDREYLHRLVDRLTPDQARHLRMVVESNPQLAPFLEPGHATDAEEETSPREPRQRPLWFGALRAEPDLAERSEDILRKEFGRRS